MPELVKHPKDGWPLESIDISRKYSDRSIKFFPILNPKWDSHKDKDIEIRLRDQKTSDGFIFIFIGRGKI